MNLTDIKFYKSDNNGLGGAIDVTNQVVSGNVNNLFPMLSKTDADAGTIRYLLLYVKNTHATETAKAFTFWEHASTPSPDTSVDWAKGIAGKNATEQTITDTYTAPTGLTWITDGTQILFGDLAPGDRWGIWFRNNIGAGTEYQESDTAVYKFKITIPSGGTGSDPDPSGGGTGGTGGNPTPTTIDWKVAVVGDWGCESTTDKVMDMCESYDKVINVGDNAYESPDCWKSKVNSHNLKSKMIANAFGNHEYSESGGISPYKTFFGLSSTYYMKKFENVAIIVIDSNINMDNGSGQNDKIREFLHNASTDPVIDWIFVTMHHPWFGSGSDHSYNDGNSVQAFHSLFTSNKVAFVFTGHNHNWQRTHKVSYNSSDPEDPNIVDSSSPFDNTTSGLIHVVSGTGGHDSGSRLYSLDDAIGTSGNPNAFQNRSNNGIYEIVASNNGKTLTCRFKALDGDVFDTITYNAT